MGRNDAVNLSRKIPGLVSFLRVHGAGGSLTGLCCILKDVENGLGGCVGVQCLKVSPSE